MIDLSRSPEPPMPIRAAALVLASFLLLPAVAGSAGRPMRSVSANIRIAVSGVFSSCETLETNCERISATRSSRRTSRHSRYAPKAASASTSDSAAM